MVIQVSSFIHHLLRPPWAMINPLSAPSPLGEGWDGGFKINYSRPPFPFSSVRPPFLFLLFTKTPFPVSPGGNAEFRSIQNSLTCHSHVLINPLSAPSKTPFPVSPTGEMLNSGQSRIPLLAIVMY